MSPTTGAEMICSSTYDHSSASSMSSNSGTTSQAAASAEGKHWSRSGSQYWSSGQSQESTQGEPGSEHAPPRQIWPSSQQSLSPAPHRMPLSHAARHWPSTQPSPAAQQVSAGHTAWSRSTPPAPRWWRWCRRPGRPSRRPWCPSWSLRPWSRRCRFPRWSRRRGSPGRHRGSRPGATTMRDTWPEDRGEGGSFSRQFLRRKVHDERAPTLCPCVPSMTSRGPATTTAARRSEEAARPRLAPRWRVVARLARAMDHPPPEGWRSLVPARGTRAPCVPGARRRGPCYPPLRLPTLRASAHATNYAPTRMA